MTIGNVQSTVESSRYIYSAKITADTTTECADIRDAVEMRTSDSESGIIGLTTISYNDNMSYSMVAKYAENSTSENPIVQVISNYGGEKATYNININEVDPSNARI